MNNLDFALETKALDEDGTIEGLAAGYGNVDYGGDVMLPGSIMKSVERKGKIPMLMFHDHRRPAGVWTDFRETNAGLLVKGRISMSTQTGREAYGLVKDGALGALSVGMVNIKSKSVGAVRHITQADLVEVSLVTVPMNERTQILSVKELASDGQLPTLPQFEDFLREAGFSKTQAAAIAGKGLSHLLRSESGSASDAAEFWRHLNA